MRGAACLILAATVLSACVPYRGFYKDGAAVAQLNADLTECQVQGVNRVPANTQIRSTPVTVTPVRRICNSAGTACRIVGGDVLGGETYSYDANAGLRNRVITQCMAARGYRAVEIPMCPQSARDTVLARAPKTLPPLGPNTCAVRGADGYLFAVTTSG